MYVVNIQEKKIYKKYSNISEFDSYDGFSKIKTNCFSLN